MDPSQAAKGQGVPATDAPTRPIIHETHRDETTDRRIRDKPASSEFVNLGFKAPKEFRHRLRKMAAAKDVSLVEVLREACGSLRESEQPLMPINPARLQIAVYGIYASIVIEDSPFTNGYGIAWT